MSLVPLDSATVVSVLIGMRLIIRLILVPKSFQRMFLNKHGGEGLMRLEAGLDEALSFEEALPFVHDLGFQVLLGFEVFVVLTESLLDQVVIDILEVQEVWLTFVNVQFILTQYFKNVSVFYNNSSITINIIRRFIK